MLKHPTTNRSKLFLIGAATFSFLSVNCDARAADKHNLLPGRTLIAQSKGVAKAAGSKSSAPAAVSSSAPIKIGFITSLTGAAAPSAKFMVDGIKLYMNQIHYKMAGRDVELSIVNDESNPATAMAAYRKLANEDKVDIIAGLALANVGYAIAPLTDQCKVPTLYVISASDDLTQRQHHNWMVRTGWSSSQPSHPFGEWVYKTLKYKRVVTFGMDYAFGYEVVGGFQKSFEDAGGKVVQKIWAPLGFSDFSTYIKKIHKDADAVFVCTFGKAAAVFPKQYKQFGPGLPLIGGGSSVDETILPQLGNEAVGTVTTMCYSGALNTRANKKFVAALHAAYPNDEASFYTESPYTTGMWINQAVTALKGNVSNKEALLAALKKVELKDAPRGPVKLDDRANPIENTYVRKVERVGGRLENTVIETFPNVSQFWKYDAATFLKQPTYSKDFPPCKYCTP